ncbi:MAG: hypothetical protein AAFO95_10760 [Cyanobacteria bacterium J06600_6]
MEQFFQSGDLIQDKYRVVDILGQGGIATTYRAENQIDGEIVAVKVLFLHQMTDWKTLELFEREAKVLSSLKHP